MLKQLAATLTLCALVAGSIPVHAGGWGVVTLDELPARVIINQPVTLGFTLRQHGQHLLSHQPGLVIFERVGEKALQFKTRSTKAEGHYTATVMLPTAGVWQWRVELFGEHPMPPLTVTATAARAARMTPTQLATLGKDLFLAKGCASCHTHQAITDSGQFSSAYGAGNAPNLTTPKFDAAYLRVWLKDPQAVKPQTQMPNLNLKADEIEALTAFLAVKRPATCPITQGRALMSTESAPIRSFVARGHVLSGIVRSGKDCAPIAGARITFLVANPQGIYDDVHSGTVITGPDGAYRFESNFPGQYESTAPHIHLLITAPGYRAIETEYLPKKGQTTGTFDVTLAAA
jgi:mono/diheme cytochrome c family protein